MFVLMAVLLFQRIFTLQIVQGEDKQQEFELKIKKERSIASTRGNIYDVNGIALAYNELSSSVTIEDVYESSKKNATINGILKKVLHILDENGDSISCDFNIYIDDDGEFAYSVTGSRRLRFIADVYGIPDFRSGRAPEKCNRAGYYRISRRLQTLRNRRTD